jgi:tetratricopeptide (TPR) repeat protein
MKNRLALLACLTLISFGILHAQRGTGSVRGTVLDDATGQPLPGVTVKMFIQALDQYYSPSPVTDKEGRWGANFLRNGMWTLEFDKTGYVPQTLSWNIGHAEEIQTASQKAGVQVRLKPIKGLMLKETIVAESKKADKLSEQKKYPEARAILEKIIADHPEAYIFYKSIGNTYFAEENYDKAIEAYTKVYTKAPDRADIAAAIANAYNNMGKKPEAAEWYAKVPVSEVQDVDTAYNAGISLYNAGNPADAIKYFQKSVEIDPNFADGYYQLGMASVASTKNDDAIAAFKKFLELAPDSPQAATAKSIVEALTKK